MTAQELFAAAFTEVLLHAVSRAPGVRHLPDGCGWVRDAHLDADEYAARYPRAGAKPIPVTAGPEHADQELCLDCTRALLRAWRDLGLACTPIGSGR